MGASSSAVPTGTCNCYTSGTQTSVHEHSVWPPTKSTEQFNAEAPSDAREMSEAVPCGASNLPIMPGPRSPALSKETSGEHPAAAAERGPAAAGGWPSSAPANPVPSPAPDNDLPEVFGDAAAADPPLMLPGPEQLPKKGSREPGVDAQASMQVQSSVGIDGETLEEKLVRTKNAMLSRDFSSTERNHYNRYGETSKLPVFKPGFHVPVLALINQNSGAQAGRDILQLARHSDYYNERFFDIIAVVRDKGPGGMLDLFRRQLIGAKNDAVKMGVRPRIISGGGDGTGSFALFIVFLALKADDSRKDGENLADTGNGFIWTDEEMETYFPALAQLPLGSANDFAHILGWGHKFPGDMPVKCCGLRGYPIKALTKWVEAVISKDAPVVNFDIWGIMPPAGQGTCNFKVCELTGKPGRTPKVDVHGQKQLVMKEASLPAPFFICLYFTAGFMAYVVARFQLNRHVSPMLNKLEYVKQAVGIYLESTPPQLKYFLDGVQVDCDAEPYFPPRRGKGNKGRRYSDVGFYNINWQGGYAHGADRAGACSRLCGTRKPVSFNDEKIDMLRVKGAVQTAIKNPGTRYQTDKRSDMTLKYQGEKGKGIFFQWDGEARLAFSPTGEAFDIHIRRVLNVPVVIGPYVSPKLTGKLDNGSPARFNFVGDTPEARRAVQDRITKLCNGQLAEEVNAKEADITAASLVMVRN